jgi:hypothetical protein
MTESAAFEYAVIRIVPNEARGEFINAGVILYCPDKKFLQARIAFDTARLAALAPAINFAHLQEHLAAILKVCAGSSEAGALGELSPAERFRWLTSPRNTLIQTSPVHTGLTDDPTKTLEHLVATLVVAPDPH